MSARVGGRATRSGSSPRSTTCGPTPRNQPEFNKLEFNKLFPASEVSGRHRATEPLEAAGDPLHDETAVFIGRLLPCEVAGIQRVDRALGSRCPQPQENETYRWRDSIAFRVQASWRASNSLPQRTTRTSAAGPRAHACFRPGKAVVRTSAPGARAARPLRSSAAGLAGRSQARGKRSSRTDGRTGLEPGTPRLLCAHSASEFD